MKSVFVIMCLCSFLSSVLKSMCLFLSLKSSPAGMNKVYWMELNAVGLNVISTEVNWSETLKATCSEINSVLCWNDSVSNNVRSDIQWALTCRNQSCCCKRNRRQFTLKGKYGLQKKALRRRKSSNWSLKESTWNEKLNF